MNVDAGAQPQWPARRVPPLGGFNITFLGLEIRRMLRNRRTVVFALVMPVLFFFLFHGRRRVDLSQAVGNGNETASVMIGLAVYGAMIAATAGGAMVSTERAQGWSRQLRLTPLRPLAYVVVKLLTGAVLGLMSVSVVFIVGALNGAKMPAGAWVVSALLAWAGALLFAAFGLFMGYLFPSENVMQILGPILAGLAFLGGLFVPLTLLGSAVQNIAPYTPAYGVGSLARTPLAGGAPEWTAVLNVVVWTGLFVSGAAALFRRDTRRV